MGYYVRALPWKKSDPRWKVQFVSYKSIDTKTLILLRPKKNGTLIQIDGAHLDFTN